MEKKHVHLVQTPNYVQSSCFNTFFVKTASKVMIPTNHESYFHHNISLNTFCSAYRAASR